ncbi:MAG TPA: hypothetical protein VG326_05475 [Tepidisphaeraceae bacterium]|jgi:hypothetical protein|nr:hypothetical protein [Tepidisphaeraceae bacterium]
MPWDPDDAVSHLWTFAHKKSIGRCAAYTADAIEAGHVHINRTTYAQDFGPRLIQAGFRAMPPGTAPQSGDVMIFPGFKRDLAKKMKKDHVAGHMQMYDGVHHLWISDFRQSAKVFPGEDFRKSGLQYTLYRYSQ